MIRVLGSMTLAVVAALTCSGCGSPADRQPAETANRAEVPPEAEEPVPAPDPALKRADLIVAALNATTAAAFGKDDRESQAQLRGRRFEARIRFACEGAATDDGDGWSYDSEKQVLRVRASADVHAESLKPSDLLGEDHEGAVGFTLRRPLLLQPGCPTPEFASVADGPAIAIVQLFTSADSRVQRPPKSFDMTLATAADDVPKDGLDLIVEGRLEPFPDQRPIHCGASSGPLACVISAKIDRIAIEDPRRKALIGQWTPG